MCLSWQQRNEVPEISDKLRDCIHKNQKSSVLSLRNQNNMQLFGVITLGGKIK